MLCVSGGVTRGMKDVQDKIGNVLEVAYVQVSPFNYVDAAVLSARAYVHWALPHLHSRTG